MHDRTPDHVFKCNNQTPVYILGGNLIGLTCYLWISIFQSPGLAQNSKGSSEAASKGVASLHLKPIWSK